MHCNEHCFTPAWQLKGWSSKEEAFKKIADYLFAHSDNIIKLGFTEEVEFQLGDLGFVLRGKNAGRKKDKRVE